MNWNGKRVLVTGAGGFIGSHLSEALLAAGANVTAMIRYVSSSNRGNLNYLAKDQQAALRFVAGDITDAAFVSTAVKGMDVVFHLAALIGIPYSYSAPFSYLRTNAEGTLNVLEAARAHGTSRIVHTSTSEAYGTALYTPMDEKHPLQGQSPYSATKIAADKIAESFHRSFGVPVVTVRPFNTFGPRQSARAIIPTIISQAVSRSEIRIGSSTPVRDMNFVKDTVQGFLALAASEKTVGCTVNLGTGQGISIGDLATRILQLMKCDKRVVHDSQRVRPEESEVFQLLCDYREATRLTGWKPTHSLDEGLLETIAFVKSYPAIYHADEYAV